MWDFHNWIIEIEHFPLSIFSFPLNFQNHIIHPVRTMISYLKKQHFNGVIYCITAKAVENALKKAGFRVLSGVSLWMIPVTIKSNLIIFSLAKRRKQGHLTVPWWHFRRWTSTRCYYRFWCNHLECKAGTCSTLPEESRLSSDCRSNR